MAQIKLNFSRLSIPEKIARARQIVTALTGNPHFTSPQPPLASITTAASELETAFADVQAIRQEAKTKTTIQNAKEDVLDKLVTVWPTRSIGWRSGGLLDRLQRSGRA